MVAKVATTHFKLSIGFTGDAQGNDYFRAV